MFYIFNTALNENLYFLVEKEPNKIDLNPLKSFLKFDSSNYSLLGNVESFNICGYISFYYNTLNNNFNINYSNTFFSIISKCNNKTNYIYFKKIQKDAENTNIYNLKSEHYSLNDSNGPRKNNKIEIYEKYDTIEILATIIKKYDNITDILTHIENNTYNIKNFVDSHILKLIENNYQKFIDNKINFYKSINNISDSLHKVINNI